MRSSRAALGPAPRRPSYSSSMATRLRSTVRSDQTDLATSLAFSLSLSLFSYYVYIYITYIRAIYIYIPNINKKTTTYIGYRMRTLMPRPFSTETGGATPVVQLVPRADWVAGIVLVRKLHGTQATSTCASPTSWELISYSLSLSWCSSIYDFMLVHGRFGVPLAFNPNVSLS